MCTLPDTDRSNSPSQISEQDRDAANAYEGSDYYEGIINQADTVPLLKVFKFYGIHCNPQHHTIRCPFKKHKGGLENTGSFKYYHETNSFRCFGCGTGSPLSHSVHFVSVMDNLSRIDAAYKVLEVFRDDVGNIGSIITQNDISEHLEILIEFSNAVREFRQRRGQIHAHTNEYAEGACQKLDEIMLKRETLDNQALRRIVEMLKEYLEMYEEPQ